MKQQRGFVINAQYIAGDGSTKQHVLRGGTQQEPLVFLTRAQAERQLQIHRSLGGRGTVEEW
jgi:hypothetical protein